MAPAVGFISASAVIGVSLPAPSPGEEWQGPQGTD
jgi:hypothetical protein